MDQGVVFKESPEGEALNRWRSGDFNETERERARLWRTALGEIDLEATYERFKPLTEGENRPRDLKGIKAAVDRMLNDPALAESMLGATLQMLGTPYERWAEIFERWKGKGRPILPLFSPYVAYVVSVEMFFSIAIAGGFVAKERATNKVDIAYLYYLPSMTPRAVSRS